MERKIDFLQTEALGKHCSTLNLGETDEILIMCISCIWHQSSDPRTFPEKPLFNYRCNQ